MDELKDGLRQATIAGKLVPSSCGTALKNKGVQPLLDAVVDYLPSPLDVPPVIGTQPAHRATRSVKTARRQRAVLRAGLQDRGRPVRRQARLLPGLLGHAQDGLVRLQRDQGQARAGRPPGADARQPARGHRRGLRGRHRRDRRPEEHVHRRHAVRPEHPIILESIVFPEPVIDVAIEPKTKADQDKMGIALARLAEEDPTFRVNTDQETGQTIIAGMGELHLEVLVDRMMREFRSTPTSAARRWPTARPSPSAAEARRPLRAPDGRPRQVRRRRARGRAAASRARAIEFDRQDRRRHRAARVRHGRRGGRARGARSGRLRELPDGRRQGARSSTARTTRSTRTRWPSRSPVRWRSRTRCERPTPAARTDHGGGGHDARTSSWAT